MFEDEGPLFRMLTFAVSLREENDAAAFMQQERMTLLSAAASFSLLGLVLCLAWSSCGQKLVTLPASTSSSWLHSILLLGHKLSGHFCRMILKSNLRIFSTDNTLVSHVS